MINMLRVGLCFGDNVARSIQKAGTKKRIKNTQKEGRRGGGDEQLTSEQT
jgi:hypothetical protein